MYAELLAALEASGLGHAARHSAWLFTAANLLHVLGSALLVGAIAVFDLKVLAAGGRGAWETGRVAIPLEGATWDAVLAPPFRMTARGLEPEMIKAGTTVTLEGYPSTKVPTELRAERITVNGRTFELR